MDRWHIVLIGDHEHPAALSRRLDGPDGPHTGEWGLLTHASATALAEAYNADPAPGDDARVVEVSRYEKDPNWMEG